MIFEPAGKSLPQWHQGPRRVDAVEKRSGVAGFAIGALFSAYSWLDIGSPIGKHRDERDTPLTQSLRGLLLLAGRVDATPLS